MFSNTFKLHTKAHTAFRGRHTLKDVVRFRNGSNLTRDHELYERSICGRTILSELSIENYAISNELSIELPNISVNLFMSIVKYLEVLENQAEYLYEL